MSQGRLPIARHEAQAAGFWTKKRLGQHLLRDPQVVADAVAALAPAPGDALLEVGPGLGALTGPLLALGLPLLAVEIDPSACEALRLRFGAEPRFKLVQADVLDLDLAAVVTEHLGPRAFHIGANLPYYITTPILAKVFESKLPFGRMVVLTQYEVAQRLSAEPDSEHWGAISVLAQYYSRVTLLRKVLRGAFTPAPKVDSALVLFERREKPAVSVKDEALFFRVVRAGFGKRRKTSRNALLMGGLGLGADGLDRAFAAAGLDSQRRAETFTLAEWAALADHCN